MGTVMRQENERGRMAVDGEHTDSGDRGEPPVVRETERQMGVPQSDQRGGTTVLGCGRSLPELHLIEAEEVLKLRYHWRVPVTLCGADTTSASPTDVEDCPGCRDCLRYCATCAREVARFSARQTGEVTTTGAMS
ncbi:MAG: hypothetical protein ACRDRS_08015 [Pseudonocardiaceae bacterium]